MKLHLSRLFLFIFAFVPAWLSADQLQTVSPQKIKIGISTTLTGEAATYGLDIRDAVTFANEKLGNGRYELIVEDDKCNAKDSVSVAHKFIDVDKVSFVIGYGCSSAALAAAPLYEKAKIPAILTAASSPKLSNAGDYIFRTTPTDRDVVRVIFEYVSAHHKKFGFISEQSQFPQDFRDAFIDLNTKNKLEIVSEDYLTSSRDTRTLLLKLRSSGIDGLFLNPQAESGLLNLVQEVRRMQWNIPIYSVYFVGSSTFIDLAKEQAEGMRGVDLPPLTDIASPEGKKLLAEFLLRYGKVRSYDAVFPTAYESFRAMDLALRSNKDPREFLYSANVDGLLGPYHFDKNGDIVGINPVMKEIKNGKVVLIH